MKRPRRKACDGRHPEIEAQAIKEGWDATKAELAVLRASRPSGPAIHIGGSNGNPIASQVIEAALCLQAGVPCEQQYAAPTLEAANKYRRRGLRWCAEQICAAHGRVIDADPGTREWIQAAFSTSELSGIVGNVANKALQSAFQAAPSVADRITAAKSHSNFHAHTVYSMVLNGDLQPVGPDGELKHLSLSEESRTRQLDTRGAVLSITRKDIINDSLIDYTPGSAVAAGDVVVQGDLVGVTKLPIAANQLGALHVDGVFDFAKNTGVSFTVGQRRCWHPAQRRRRLIARRRRPRCASQRRGQPRLRRDHRSVPCPMTTRGTA